MSWYLIWILADVRWRTSDVRHLIILDDTDVAHDGVRGARMSYVIHVRHRISMSYVRHERDRNIRCRTCTRYRRSDRLWRTTSYLLIVYDIICFDLHIVRSCIQHRIQHRIRHRIWHRMRCSFNWIWSGVQGGQITCTIAQAQAFAW